ncbi:MAG: hypothetical protein ACP5OP_05120 [Leptospirillia bacterium]
MNENILSQDEVNALLRGIANGEVETLPPQEDQKATGSKPREYTIASQERVIRGCMPTLDIINERFTRFFQISLSATLRKPAEFSPVSTETIKFGEFIKKIALPSSL